MLSLRTTVRDTSKYGSPPRAVAVETFNLAEVMYYLYLPVVMRNETDGHIPRMPSNLSTHNELYRMIQHAHYDALRLRGKLYKFTYLSARKGWATPDNPLNRPGWHADGFGTDDLNYVWWRGPGTRFALGDFGHISSDHTESLRQFTDWIASHKGREIEVKADYPEATLYCLDPSVVHATPEIKTPGWRQYVKISLSDERYNLENNSHNYLFNYKWELHGREDVRNDTSKSQRDYA